MRHLVAALLYTSLALVAIPASAADPASLRSGDMKKLNFHETPMEIGAGEFATFDGAPASLADYAGKTVLVNFWATWCAPCREEMPTLSALQADLGGADFEVVTIATGRNPPPAMTGFFDEIGVDNLPLYRDPRQTLARKMGVFGLPITVILDAQGREIARLRGDADWSSQSAHDVLNAVIDNQG